jgi:hypothetical protein
MENPNLRFLHSSETLNRVKLEFFRKLPTPDLKESLLPGKEGSLKVRNDGTVLDGHHRAQVLAGTDGARRKHRGPSTRDNRKAVMTPDLYWISGPWKGRLAISARPRGSDWLEDEVPGWRRAGVDFVVSLLESSEEAQLQLEQERELSERSGLEFFSFPIPDRGVPAANGNATALLSRIRKELSAGKNVAVHCRQGIGRSGLITAGVLIMSGLPVEKAIRAVSDARGLPIPETRVQSDWLHRLEANRVALVS